MSKRSLIGRGKFNHLINIMLNHHLSQKLKLIGRGKFNHLINTLTKPTMEGDEQCKPEDRKVVVLVEIPQHQIISHSHNLDLQKLLNRVENIFGYLRSPKDRRDHSIYSNHVVIISNCLPGVFYLPLFVNSCSYSQSTAMVAASS
jgi:hypothetical protein